VKFPKNSSKVQWTLSDIRKSGHNGLWLDLPSSATIHPISCFTVQEAHWKQSGADSVAKPSYGTFTITSRNI